VRKVGIVAAAVLALGLAGCGDDGGTTEVADGIRPFPEVTAPLPDPGEEPEDGEHAAEIIGVDPVAGTLVVNFISFLAGDEAAEAFEAETGGEAGMDGPPNDYWIETTSPSCTRIQNGPATSSRSASPSRSVAREVTSASRMTRITASSSTTSGDSSSTSSTIQ
jgi:hypothetical protein